MKLIVYERLKNPLNQKIYDFYGAAIYSSAKTCILNRLNSVHHSVIKTCQRSFSYLLYCESFIWKWKIIAKSTTWLLLDQPVGLYQVSTWDTSINFLTQNIDQLKNFQFASYTGRILNYILNDIFLILSRSSSIFPEFKILLDFFLIRNGKNITPVIIESGFLEPALHYTNFTNIFTDESTSHCKRWSRYYMLLFIYLTFSFFFSSQILMLSS